MENTTEYVSVSEINCQKSKYVEIYNTREEDIHLYIFHGVFRFDKILRYEILLHIGIYTVETNKDIRCFQWEWFFDVLPAS